MWRPAARWEHFTLQQFFENCRQQTDEVRSQNVDLMKAKLSRRDSTKSENPVYWQFLSQTFNFFNTYDHMTQL